LLLATITVVLANVGNVNVPACQDQVFKLCQRPVEARATEAFAALRPDVTGLIEVLPADLCARAPSTMPSNLCSGLPDPPSQVARLLGADVDEACDARFGWDCVAVRRGGMVGLDGPLETRPVLDACSDTGFTLSTGTLRVRGWPVAVAVAHPDSTDSLCRAAQLRDLFDAGLPAAGPALVLGDLNVDFYREDDASAEVMKEIVPSRFTALSTDELTSFPGAPSQLDATGETLDGDVALPAGPLGPRTLDHVLARGLGGSCDVQRVDGGGGMDHRAQVCSVAVPASVAPKLRVRRSGCRLRVSFAPARDDIRAVRLRLGRRTRVDRAAPFTIRAGSARRLRVQALTLAGPGPLLKRRVARCRQANSASTSSAATSTTLAARRPSETVR